MEDCFISLAAIVIVALFSIPVIALEVPHHVVISEVYVNAIDEYNSEWIELYNPTDQEINISRWKINTKAYQPDATIPSPVTIPPHGFYLIGDKNWNPDNSSWCTPDHRENITLGNTDSWINLTNSTGAPIDTVGWGSATINETLSFSINPQQNKSIERISLSENHAPCQDTGNNSFDFFLQDTPTPMNSSSSKAPAFYNFSLSVDKEVETVLQNKNATYLITINNTGDVTDSYTLSVDNSDNANIAVLNVSEVVNLSKSSSRSVELNVSNPMPGTFRVNVTVASRGNISLSDSVNTTTYVGQSPVVLPECSLKGYLLMICVLSVVLVASVLRMRKDIEKW